MQGEVRRVANLGLKPFSDRFDGVPYVIDPGGEAIVPREATDLWFGNPDLVDRLPYKKDRQDEHNRLLIRYGQQITAEGAVPTMPEVRVMTLSGETITTVLDDPTGDSVNEASLTVDEQDQLFEAIRAHRDELDLLKEEYRKLARQNEALAEGRAEVDEPQAVASRRARKAGSVPAVGVEEDVPSRT